MAAATVTTSPDNFLGHPGMEFVQLTASDGETYVSRRLKKILAVFATSNSNNDAYLNATFSGQTVTINYAGQTDKLVSVLIIGQP